MLSLMLAAAAAAAAPARVPTRTEQAAVRRVVEARLKDSSSAQYRWQKVRAGSIYCGEINSKNTYGGYAGFSEFMVFYNHERGLASVYPGASIAELGDPAVSGTIAKTCRQSGYFQD